jgi:hypothetical protein
VAEKTSIRSIVVEIKLRVRAVNGPRTARAQTSDPKAPLPLCLFAPLREICALLRRIALLRESALRARAANDPPSRAQTSGEANAWPLGGTA